MSVIELIAVAFGIVSVVFCICQNIWNWPTGLVQVILSIVVYYRAELYSDMVLQIIFVPLQFYGWWYWLYGDKNQTELPITRLTTSGIAGWTIASAVLIATDGYVMHRYFGAAAPYWDAAIAVLSLVAQYLIARKVIDNWPIWIAVDILAIGVCASKGLYLFAGLAAVFLVLASFGWAEWIRSLRIQGDPPPPPRGFEVVMASSSASSCPPTSATSTSPTSPETSSTA